MLPRGGRACARLARHGYLDYTGRDGSSAADRATRSGYRWRVLGENIASGQTTADQVVRDWTASPEHCANLMNAEFTDMGVACAVDKDSPQGIYWAQEFGRAGQRPADTDRNGFVAARAACCRFRASLFVVGSGHPSVPICNSSPETHMPVLDNYLFFNGNCAEAMRFYERTLGGKIETMMTYAQSPQPEHCPAESQDRIMHARLVLDGRALMASDTPAGQASPGMNGFALSLNCSTANEARRLFDALAAGGKVTMPMTKTFWAEAFGMLSDRFGTPWMVGGGMPG